MIKGMSSLAADFAVIYLIFFIYDSFKLHVAILLFVIKL